MGSGGPRPLTVSDDLTSDPIDRETFVNGNNRVDEESVWLCFSLKARVAEMRRIEASRALGSLVLMGETRLAVFPASEDS